MLKQITYLIALSIILIGCSSETTYTHLQENAPKLTGQIIGYNPNMKVEITMVTPASNNQRAFPIEVDNNGKFELQLDHPLKYRQGWFGAGEENEGGSMKNSYWAGLIINEGLHLDIDFSQDSTIGAYNPSFVDFSGPDADLNRYTQNYNSHRWETNIASYQDPFPIIMRFSTPVMENLDTLQSVFHHNRNQDSIYFNNHPSPYSKLLRNESKSGELGLLNTLNWQGKMPQDIANQINNHQPLLLANSSIIDFYNYQAQRIKGDIMVSGKARIKAFRQQYNDNTDQERFGHFVDQLEKKYSKAPYDTLAFENDMGFYSNIYKNEILISESEAYLDSIQKLSPEKADILNLVGGFEDIWKQELYMTVSADRFNIPAYQEIALKEWAKDAPKISEINEQLSKINMAGFSDDLGGNIEETPLGATMIESSITDVDTLIGTLRNRLNGKHIVLDIWATWCAPCLADMKNSIPNLTKLEDRDIEVIYLCSSSSGSTDAWRKKIAEVKSPKTHLYMTPELSKSIMEDFKLMGYPSHVFIDRNGAYHEDVVKFIEHIDFEKLDQKLLEIEQN